MTARTIEASGRRRGRVGIVPAGGRTEVRRERLDGHEVVVKAGRGHLRESLRREAEVLARCDGSGTVRLVELVEGPDHTEVVTAAAGTITLAEAAMLAPAERAAALASLCRTVDRLHAAGWAHGNLVASHVIVGDHILDDDILDDAIHDDDAAVALCSAGRAVPTDSGPDTALGDDRHALAAVVVEVLHLAGAFDSRAARRRWDRATRRATAVLTGPGGLRSGRQILNVLDRAGVTAPSRPRHRRRPAVHRVLAPLLVAGLLGSLVGSLAGGVAAVAVGLAGSGELGRAQAHRPPADPAPTWSSSVVGADGRVRIDSRSYEVGEEGDVVAIGDWDCDGHATAALLRPDTGEVWTFPRGSGVTARPAGRTEGAVDLVGPAHSWLQGCGPPRVRLGDGTVVPLGDDP